LRKYGRIILFILIVSVLAAGCASDTSDKNDENSQNTGAVSSKGQSTSLYLGSLENPAGIGDAVSVSPNDVEEYKITIIEAKRGDDANSLVKSASASNRIPAAGHEYLLVKANVAYTKGEDKVMMSRSKFVACCDDKIEESKSVELPEDYSEFSGWSNPGEQKEGWIAFEVPTGKDVIIKYKPSVSQSKSAYISLGN
jgi:hypothetical protein